MLTIEALVALVILILAFSAGKMISDRYNDRIISELQFQLRLASAEKGVGYVAPPAKKKIVPIGQPFMDALQKNGRAVQKIER
jgi:hypothetical protein